VRALLLLCVTFVTGCGSLRGDPTATAEQCVRSQVADGAKLSADRARQIVSACDGPVRKWLDASMRAECEGPCDYSKSQIIRERNARKAAIDEFLMGRIPSDVALDSERM
jgi:hypothetical protein